MTEADKSDNKRDRLLAILLTMPSAAVAFSGGVDSAVMAKAAYLALGGKAIAVTADSPSVAQTELEDARRIAVAIGIRHIVIKTFEFDNPDYIRNDGTRCYHCKSELYAIIGHRIAELGVEVICSGANLDDLGDYRPGLTAAAEHAVRHPLQEAGFSKSDVRELAKQWGLPVWDKPASPCLSSRIAPGLPATPERTRRVERAEAYLKTLGVRECRVRYHDGDLARVEVPLDSIAILTNPQVRSRFVTMLQEIGFRYVTLDLAGFRSGSLNDMVPLEVRKSIARRQVTL